MYFSKSVNETFKLINSSKAGLTSAEAQTRLEKYGENEIKAGKKKLWILKLLSQFSDVMIIFLLVAGFISAIVGFVTKSKSELLDATIILLIVFVNAVIGFIQECKAEHAIDALKKMSIPYAKVLRNGVIESVKTTQLVVGDIVYLEAGDIVPADIRLIEAVELKISESALTGESKSVRKSCEIVSEKAPLAERKNMAYSSGIVDYGHGYGVVVATGMNSEVGRIASLLSSKKTEETGLQKKINKTGKVITLVCLVAALIIFVMSLVIKMGLLSAFMTAISICVAAIPEGLPAVITIIMAIGVQRLSKKRAIVKKLTAVETLGSTEIICSDKTGTLTINKMSVKKISLLPGKAENKQDLALLLKTMVICNDAKMNTDKKGVSFVGDPTETALLEYAYNKLEDKALLKASRLKEKPFDSKRKLMSVACSETGLVHVKGAPDEILKICTHVLDNGKVREMTAFDKERVRAEISHFAKDALRVLGFAYKHYKMGEELEEKLIFLGIAGLIDPPRKEAKHAIEKCWQAGMRVIMITGDHKDTAFAIGKELGLAKSESEILSGAELDEFTDEQFSKMLPSLTIFARVSPENKVRIVKTFKKLGKVVAMTGDGVNDAPSLKEADIGIGMGKNGTEVAKSVSDIVLADDNFSTIVTAVEEGRKIYSNIIKSIGFLLSANIAEILSLLIVTMCIAPFMPSVVFLVPVQILFVNLITDTFPALALGVEPLEPNAMKRPPRKDKPNLLAGRVGFNIIYQGLVQTVLVLAVFLIGLFCFSNEVASTMALISLNFIQLFHALNMRSETESLLKLPAKKNKLMLISFVVSACLIFAVCLIPPLMTAFKTVRLSLLQWVISLGFAVLIIPIVEAVKAVQRKKITK